MSIHRTNFFILFLFAVFVVSGYYYFYLSNKTQRKSLEVKSTKSDLLGLGYSFSQLLETEGLGEAEDFLNKHTVNHEEYRSVSLSDDEKVLYFSDDKHKGTPSSACLPMDSISHASLEQTQCYVYTFSYFDAGIKKDLRLSVMLTPDYLQQLERKIFRDAIDEFVVFLLLLLALFFTLYRADTSFFDKKKKEQLEDLHKTNKLFAEAQTMGRFGNWEWDITNNKIRWSDEIYRIFGLQPKAFAPAFDAFMNIVHPDDREKVQQALDQSLEKGLPYRVKHRILLADGSIKIVQERGEAKFDAEGKTLSMAGSVLDITEQQRKEDALVLQAEILDSISDAIFVHPQDGKFIYVNQAACYSRGFSKEEFLDMGVEDLDTPCTSPTDACATRMKELHKQILTSGLATFETSHRRKFALPIPVEIASRLFYREDKSFIISIARDISERKEVENKLIASEIKFRALVENSLIGVYTSDVRGHIYYVNEALVSMMEYDSAEELMATNFSINYKDPRERVKMIQILEKEKKITNHELELITKKKNVITILISATLSDESLSGTIINITKEKRAQEEIRKLSSAMEQIDDIVTISDRGGIIEYVNEAFVVQTGYSRAEVYGRKPSILKSGEHTQQFYKEMWSTILSGDVYKNRLVNHKKNGERYYEEKTITPLKDEKESVYAFVSTAKDITKNVMLEQALEQMARSDQLTGICNRHCFEEFCDKELSRANRYEKPLSLIMLDIDHFKNVNDTYGHDIGDVVLKQITETVRQSIRKSDVFARWGGEEFMVLCSDTDEENAAVLAEKLRQKIANHNFDKPKHITASFGVTQFISGEEKEAFLKRADKALYLAKERGRDRLEIA